MFPALSLVVGFRFVPIVETSYSLEFYWREPPSHSVKSVHNTPHDKS